MLLRISVLEKWIICRVGPKELPLIAALGAEDETGGLGEFFCLFPPVSRDDMTIDNNLTT